MASSKPCGHKSSVLAMLLKARTFALESGETLIDSLKFFFI